MAMDKLEYDDVFYEFCGYMTPGRIKMYNSSIIFKNDKTGRVENINASDIEMVNFQKFVDKWGIRIFTKQGRLHRFSGFKEKELGNIAKYFKEKYGKEMLEQELFLKGWNWGVAEFKGNVLSFSHKKKTSFEIPLNNVSQCHTGKNEVTLQFHQNDDAPVGLLEMRFHVPSNETDNNDAVQNFYQNVMSKASVISASGDAIATFTEIYCLTPRGRYDIKIFQSFFQLHGKTFDFKIPMSTILRMFLLEHKDKRQCFFVLSLDPPIKHGQTRYHFLVLLFANEDEVSIELPFSEEEIEEKYENKFTKNLSGTTYTVMGRIMKVLANQKIIGVAKCNGNTELGAIGCSFKAAAGYLYFLERGVLYIHKPPIHIRFEEISAVNFARNGVSTRSFDFEISLKSGVTHTFNSIEKGEYGKLFNFIRDKKIHIKNTRKMEKVSYKEDFLASENEDEPDAYLERIKAEAKNRDSDDNNVVGSDKESTDEDFVPGEPETEVEDEYDSNVQSTSTSSDEINEVKKNTGAIKKKKQESKIVIRENSLNDDVKEEKSGTTTMRKLIDVPKDETFVHEMIKRSKAIPKQSSTKNQNIDLPKPKRCGSSYMLWFNENRETIKKNNPNLTATEIAKKAGEIWRNVKDKNKWEVQIANDKERYRKEMAEYQETLRRYNNPNETDDKVEIDDTFSSAQLGKGGGDADKNLSELEKNVSLNDRKGLKSIVTNDKKKTK